MRDSSGMVKGMTDGMAMHPTLGHAAEFSQSAGFNRGPVGHSAELGRSTNLTRVPTELRQRIWHDAGDNRRGRHKPCRSGSAAGVDVMPNKQRAVLDSLLFRERGDAYKLVLKRSDRLGKAM
jgi:hypothetical protein